MSIISCVWVLRQIAQVEALIGKGKTGWYDCEQRLRYERYFADNGDGEVTFVYTDGEDNGILNRLTPYFSAYFIRDCLYFISCITLFIGEVHFISVC